MILTCLVAFFYLLRSPSLLDVISTAVLYCFHVSTSLIKVRRLKGEIIRFMTLYSWVSDLNVYCKLTQAVVCTWSSSVQISLSAPREGRPTTNLSTHFKHTLGLTVTVKPTQQSSRACVSAKLLSCVWLFATPRTVAPLSMGFSRREYRSGLPFSPPADLPDPGIKPESLRSSALSGGLFTTSTTWTSLGSPCYLTQWMYPARGNMQVL